ncbi:MAG: hypothetical protein KHW84_13425 [Enterobacter cloacae]|nr:hypothetical protein [Enterobacter cloacae]
MHFQGRYLDRETGQHYSTYRYQDPADRRYKQVSPPGLIDGLNTYIYVVKPLELSFCNISGDNTPYHSRIAPHFTERFDPLFLINARTFNSGISSQKATSGVKNFWQQRFYLQPDSSSKKDLCKIQKTGISSEISSTWINHFPKTINYKFN